MTIAALALAVLQAIAPTLQVVTLESLVSSPARYNGREITVAVRIIQGEGLMVILPARRGGMEEVMWVDLAKAVEESTRPADIGFVELLRKRSMVVAILRARFTAASTRQFGHQGCCRYKLEVVEVLSSG
jgi:hypothetical protein